MAIARLDFSGSTAFRSLEFATESSKHMLLRLNGWKENPSQVWDTYPRWNGRGSFVSRRTRVPERAVEMDLLIEGSKQEIREILEDLGRASTVRNITLEVEENGIIERASEGIIEAPREFRQREGYAIIKIFINFQNPYIINLSNNEERL